MAGIARCPGCGSAMRPKHRFCTECGRRNPLFAAAPVAAGKAAQPGAVKAAAPVVVKSVQQQRREYWLSQFYAEPDPDRAMTLWRMAHPELGGMQGGTQR